MVGVQVVQRPGSCTALSLGLEVGREGGALLSAVAGLPTVPAPLAGCGACGALATAARATASTGTATTPRITVIRAATSIHIRTPIPTSLSAARGGTSREVRSFGVCAYAACMYMHRASY